MNNIDQLSGILKEFGFKNVPSAREVFLEIISLLPKSKGHQKIPFTFTVEDDLNRIFDFGCDSVVKRFEEEFEANIH